MDEVHFKVGLTRPPASPRLLHLGDHHTVLFDLKLNCWQRDTNYYNSRISLFYTAPCHKPELALLEYCHEPEDVVGAQDQYYNMMYSCGRCGRKLAFGDRAVWKTPVVGFDLRPGLAELLELAGLDVFEAILLSMPMAAVVNRVVQSFVLLDGGKEEHKDSFRKLCDKHSGWLL